MATNTRTYGKRSRKQNSLTVRDSEQDSPSPSLSARKRQKLSSRTPSPALTDDAEPLEDTLRSASIVDDADEGPPPNPFASPGRPKKPARDLSGIFGAITSAQSSSPSPTKLARRMLGRSKTETSITNEATADGSIDRTFSLPSLPSSPSRPVPFSSKSSSALLPVLPPAAESPKTRTYAGKYRSFLVNVPSSSTQQSQILEDENEFDTRESYNSLRERWGVDNSEDDPYPQVSPAGSFTATPDASPSRKGKAKATALPRPPPVPYPGGLSNPLKSISELRNKGESRRFLDELGYLFEGLDRNGGIGLKRASALEICTKLCDSDFARKAKAADLYARTWDLLVESGGGQGEDKILDIIMVFFAALVARDPTSLAELASRPPSEPSSSSTKNKHEEADHGSFVEVLFAILSSMTPDADPLVVVASRPGVGDTDLKKVGLAKRDRAILTSVYQTITKSAIFQPDTPISISLLTSHTLSVLPSSLIPATPNHFSTFLKSLRYSLAPNAAGTGAGTSFSSLAASLALRWTDAAQSVPLQSVYQHLRLLDAYLLDQWQVPPSEGESSQGTDVTDHGGSGNGNGSASESWREANDAAMKTARDTWLAQDLVAFGVCTELFDGEDEPDAALPKKCLDMTLRVLVSLTHGNKRWGRTVTEGEHTMGLLLRTIYASARGLQASRREDVAEQAQSPAKIKAESEDGDGDSEYVAPTSDDEPTVDATKAGPGGLQYIDTLCLALGLLTNLVQIADSAKRIVRETSLDPACRLRKRACARKCVCPQRTGALKILADIYTQFHIKVESASTTKDSLSTDSPEAHAEADASFLRGHLAVLFGLLMMDYPKNQTDILSALPAPATGNSKAKDQIKLSRLVDQAKDFAAFYSAVSNTIGGEKESRITTEVVQFLEAQRDAAS
ncbi:hypothetical protein D9619_006277 [Psilocybe cf. subviscida]|uniref:Wings apart-like protein C-terminal domain-containing protein n=1 Tax=Psilocybe cf. subviscida TaxID=2480587 RepID=A0A8H5B3Z8_9AGAR|nr:hypothetical protein D9619_006277 [Psilocybe cf. subviscida]